MNPKLKNNGFSLTEVLMAVGTLAVGMIFVAGVFPVAIHFTTIATERTKAAIVADEAFAKIRLYDVNTANRNYQLAPFESVVLRPVDPNEFAYPSTYTVARKQYYWSALCRRVGGRDVQVTVFVCRKIGTAATYWVRNNLTASFTIGNYPVPVLVEVDASLTGRFDELSIIDRNRAAPDEETFVNDGYTIIDNETGRLYRVLERDADRPDTILLDGPWRGNPPDSVWVVPPPVDGGRYPCIAIYQKVIRF